MGVDVEHFFKSGQGIQKWNSLNKLPQNTAARTADKVSFCSISNLQIFKSEPAVA